MMIAKASIFSGSHESPTAACRHGVYRVLMFEMRYLLLLLQTAS